MMARSAASPRKRGTAPFQGTPQKRGARDGWFDAACRQAADAVYQEQELRRIVDEFARAGISPIFLKGAALAYTIYPEAALRPGADHDMLIRPDEAVRVRSIFERLGYEPELQPPGQHIASQFAVRRTDARAILYLFDVHLKISNALAYAGWHVVAFDLAAAVVDAAKANAARAGVHVDWHCQDITRDFVSDRAFDLVCLFGQVYSLIPDRQRRFRLLSVCRRQLKEDGICLLDYYERPAVTDRERQAHRWRRGLAWLVRGNRECQLGDQWLVGGLFFHGFATREEFIEEVAAAGFRVELAGEGAQPPVAILRPAAPRSSVSTVPENVSG